MEVVSPDDSPSGAAGAARIMATSSTPLLGSARKPNGTLGLLVAGGILFVIGFAGSSVLLGSECGTFGSPVALHGRA